MPEMQLPEVSLLLGVHQLHSLLTHPWHVDCFVQLSVSAAAKPVTGILLFIAMMERHVVVLADRTIAEKCAPDTWDGIVKSILEDFKAGKMSDGIVKAIGQCGEILSKHFPIKPGDTNELRNQLVIKE